MSVDTLSMSLIVKPLTIINITVGMNKSTVAISLVVFPPSFIHGTVGPNLLALSFSHLRIDDPLTLILGVVLEQLHFTVLDITSKIHRPSSCVVERSKLIEDFIDSVVFVVRVDTSFRSIAHPVVRELSELLNLLSGLIASPPGLDSSDDINHATIEDLTISWSGSQHVHV